MILSIKEKKDVDRPENREQRKQLIKRLSQEAVDLRRKTEKYCGPIEEGLSEDEFRAAFGEGFLEKP